MVDTRDLKSLGPKRPCGFDSRPRHKTLPNLLWLGFLFVLRRGRELGPSGHEAAGAPDAVPPLAPTMSLTTRGRRGTPQLDAHPSGGNSPQLSPFALAREPVAPATRLILRLLRPSNPTPVPGLLLKTRILGRFCRFSPVRSCHTGPTLFVIPSEASVSPAKVLQVST